MARKESICDLCGEQKFISHKLKDGTMMCDSCEKRLAHGFSVEWKKVTKNDFHYFYEVPVADENFHPDFDFEGFRADTKSGMFAINYNNELFEFKNISKYYITYIYRDIHSTSEYKEVRGARLVIELKHPVISSVQQRISRDKSSALEVLDVLDIIAKKSFEKHNAPIFELLKKQTGKNMSMPKRENR